MKKIIICSLIILAMCAAVASADIIGTFSRSNMDAFDEPEKADLAIVEGYKNTLLASVFDKDIARDRNFIKYYSNLTLLQMALSKYDIDAIAMPEFVGEFMLRSHSLYKLRGFMIGKNSVALAFGFLEDNKELRDKFSKTVDDMRREGVIGILARDFISGPNSVNPQAVSFENFEGAETIHVAFTGDIPPLDYVAPDGAPTGFNTAMLAEIGRRLHVNIKPVIVETDSRAMALKSGRADVVFWFQIFTGYDKQPDIPESVIVSSPYYIWNKTMLIGRK